MVDGCRIRAARSADLDGVLRIEASVFVDPWSVGMFQAHLHDVFLVAEQGAAVIGYLVARSVPPQAEILNVAVAPTARRGGVGRALLAAALVQLEQGGVDTVYLEVRASNVAAQRLYEETGFAPVGVRRGYYTAPLEDAVVMRRDGPRAGGIE